MASLDNEFDGIKDTKPLKNRSVNYWWRLFATGFSFTTFGLGALVLGFVFLAMSLLPAGHTRKQHWYRQLMSKGCKGYINLMKSLGLLSYTITPQPTINTCGKVVVANHPTLLDAVFIISMCPNLCCITKRALWSNPITSSIVRMAGYIRNDEAEFLQLATGKLRKGENLLIFPEGTRNCRDNQLAFKRGAANIAIISESDILPIVIHCYPRTLQKNQKWYNIPQAAPHFRITILPAFSIAKYIESQQTPRPIQYRRLTRALKQIYEARLP